MATHLHVYIFMHLSLSISISIPPSSTSSHLHRNISKFIPRHTSIYFKNTSSFIWTPIFTYLQFRMLDSVHQYIYISVCSLSHLVQIYFCLSTSKSPSTHIGPISIFHICANTYICSSAPVHLHIYEFLYRYIHY